MMNAGWHLTLNQWLSTITARELLGIAMLFSFGLKEMDWSGAHLRSPIKAIDANSTENWHFERDTLTQSQRNRINFNNLSRCSSTTLRESIVVMDWFFRLAIYEHRRNLRSDIQQWQWYSTFESIENRYSIQLNWLNGEWGKSLTPTQSQWSMGPQ